ncbi:hypothetical protein C8Q77DRAFT_183047 [Trametes polyzona]|nr:hypothetical protein C8Q77DRAFT_183047 [Trametes polyzona]
MPCFHGRPRIRQTPSPYPALVHAQSPPPPYSPPSYLVPRRRPTPTLTAEVSLGTVMQSESGLTDYRPLTPDSGKPAEAESPQRLFTSQHADPLDILPTLSYSPPSPASSSSDGKTTSASPSQIILGLPLTAEPDADVAGSPEGGCGSTTLCPTTTRKKVDYLWPMEVSLFVQNRYENRCYLDEEPDRKKEIEEIPAMNGFTSW